MSHEQVAKNIFINNNPFLSIFAVANTIQWQNRYYK